MRNIVVENGSLGFTVKSKDARAVISGDEVLKILTARHELSPRQCDLVKDLIKEVMA